MSGRTLTNITRYTVYDSVNQDDDLFNISTGATLVLLGVNSLTDDAVEGSGRVSVRGPTTIDDGLALSGATVFVDLSSVTLDDGTLTLGQTSDDSVTARNIASATWTLADGAGITGAGSSKFVNLGTLVESGGSSTIDANFYDRGGTIQADGTLSFDSPGDLNRFVNDTVGGSGEFELDGGVVVGSNVSTSTFRVIDAQTIGNVDVSSAQVSLFSTLNIEAGSVLSLTDRGATVDLGEGFIAGAGEIDIKGDDDMVLMGEPTVGGMILNRSIAFDNFADTTFVGGFDRFVGGPELYTEPRAGAQITIDNEAGATWTDTGDSSATYMQFGGSGSSLFLNDGTFIQDVAAGGVTFGLAVENNGVMEAALNGTSVDASAFFVFNDPVSGTGTIELGANNLTLDDSVASSQTVNFNATPSGFAPPTLTLNDPQDFAGTVAGFDQGSATDDKIVLNTTTWQYQNFVANGGGTGGSLVLSNGSADAYVDLAGSYQPNGFHAVVSGAQTTITYAG